MLIDLYANEIEEFDNMIRCDLERNRYDGRIGCTQEIHDAIEAGYGTESFTKLFNYYSEYLDDYDCFQSLEDWRLFVTAFLPDYFGMD